MSKEALVKQEQGEPVKVWQEIDCPNCGDMARMFTPQQRTWVGLTVKDIDELMYLTGANRQRTAVEMAFAVEVKLKEKNNGT